jgi:nucleotide-binding universal stress UspA family protein
MRFNTIVVGIDFSERSLATARWVADHLSPSAEIVFVHVVPEPETPSFLQPHLRGVLDEVSGVVPALIPGLRGVAELVAPGRHRIEIVTGITADGLAQVAADVGADLICLGRRRLRRGGARFGATTAHRLLARTRVPVLVVPGKDESAPTRILAALDAREGGDSIARAAARLAGSWEAHVNVVHVLSPELRDVLQTSHAAHAWNADSEISSGVQGTTDVFRLTREWLEQQADLAGLSPARVRAGVSIGDPGQEIIRSAHQSRANLIVMGRGTSAAHPSHTGLLPLGSTTRHVMWAAPCPVLVLPTESLTQRQSSWRTMRTRSRKASPPAKGFVSEPELDPRPPAARFGVATCDCCPTPGRSAS